MECPLRVTVSDKIFGGPKRLSRKKDGYRYGVPGDSVQTLTPIPSLSEKFSFLYITIPADAKKSGSDLIADRFNLEFRNAKNSSSSYIVKFKVVSSAGSSSLSRQSPMGESEEQRQFDKIAQRIAAEFFDECRTKGSISPPATLKKIDRNVGRYGIEELNEALLTVFGEMSARLHGKLFEEAKAIASTIINRHRDIVAARAAAKDGATKLREARNAREKALKHHDELARNPSKYRREMKDYDAAVKEAKRDYDKKHADLGKAQIKARELNDAKIAAESRVAKKFRDKDSILLTYIVDNGDQYKGYVKGKKDFQAYPSLPAGQKERNHERWQIAKAALIEAASNPESRDAYRNFRANYSLDKDKSNDRNLDKNTETRIGGNDFWE